MKISSHLGRAWFLLYDCLVMLEPYYACCKHGPTHTRRGGCGFVHSLSDLRMPITPPPQVWRDRSHARGGPAGIDWFLGQAYTVSQSRRLLRYLTSESVSSMPPWARRLCWFMDIGEADEYVRDADFGWAEEIQKYLGIGVTYGHDRARPCFPFDLQQDQREPSMSLDDRMCLRMTNGRDTYGRYRARVSWHDAHKFVLVTGPSRCRHDRQYLNLVGGDEYVRILEGSGDASWWYMVPLTALPKILSRGGWAPSVYFESTGDPVDLYEVPLDKLRPGSAQSAAEEVVAPLALTDWRCIRVHVYGAADDRRGICAACFSRDFDDRDLYASLALPGMTGAECSTLLGIVLGLWWCYQGRHTEYRDSRFVLLVDSVDAINHVFETQDPTGESGWDLYPAIMLARVLVSHLSDLGIHVSLEKVASSRNLAHFIANTGIRTRRQGNWLTSEDEWPEVLPRVFQDVWHDVARNCRGEGVEGMHIQTRNKCHAPLRFRFSDAVLSALDSVARGDA